MIRYLVSYIDPPTADTGNCEMTVAQPPRDMDDVRSLTRELRNDLGLVNPILLGWSAFSDHEAQR